ncbi:hypothetical protein V2J09_006461 [Rumex salicifolius]
MAILNYFTVYSAATVPTSQEPPRQESIPNSRLNNVNLPEKNPVVKLANGDSSSSQVGGPTTTTKLRKYWGGEQEDPITSSDLIWNRDFMPQMEKLVVDQPDPTSATLYRPVEEESSGFLSLSRVMDLDSLEVDLSASLAVLTKVAELPAATTEKPRRLTKRWKLAPTRKEQDKWDRATKAATGGSDVMFRELRKPRGDPKVLAAQAREQYYKLKNKLQTLTLGVGGVGLVSAYVSYTPEIAVSFGAGLIGSLIYIRMLGSTVDSMGNASQGLMKGAVGQPRLLVPAVLVMFYNRWNAIVVPEYGFMHLELIPILVGFFTYKIATFIQAIEEAILIVENKSET